MIVTSNTDYLLSVHLVVGEGGTDFGDRFGLRMVEEEFMSPYRRSHAESETWEEELVENVQFPHALYRYGLYELTYRLSPIFQ